MPVSDPLTKDSSDKAAIDFALSVLARLPATAVLADLHSQISSAIYAHAAPYPLPSASVPPALNALPIHRAAYDEFHSGRFTVLSTGGATVACDAVLERPDPFAFIRENLACDESGGGGDDNETVIFLPGMNTPHERRDGYFSYTAPERLVHYSRVLGCKRIAQLHTGTSQDQPPIRVTVSDSPFFGTLVRLLRKFGAVDLDGDGEKGDEMGDGDLILSAEVVDSLQVVFSVADIEDNLMQKGIAKLILLATPSEPVVFMAYSRSSIEIATTLRRYISDRKASGTSLDDIESHLRRSVTVLSIGAATSHWPDGPAYIHLGSIHDPVTNFTGVHTGRTRGAGKDAVFLTATTKVYGGNDGENHNFSCLTSQYLSVIMLANETTSIRRLYDLARGTAASGEEGETGVTGRNVNVSKRSTSSTKRLGTGQCLSFSVGLLNALKGFLPSSAAVVGGANLVIPDNVEELMMAMIRVSSGMEYCKVSLRDSELDAVLVEPPSMEDSLALLKEYFDEEKIDRIHTTCRDIFCEESEYAKPRTYPKQ